jgi:N-acetylmuramoyl-L-alanine amidase
MKVAIVIGHSEGIQGASNSVSGHTEWEVNSKLAIDVKHTFDTFKETLGIEAQLFYRDDLGVGAMLRLVNRVNQSESDLCISLHLNAFNREAHGCETLYWGTSMTGLTVASVMQEEVCKVLGNANRGVKPKRIRSRGAYILRKTHMPCVILEPFFIDNLDELANGLEKMEDLGSAIVEGIRQCKGLL